MFKQTSHKSRKYNLATVNINCKTTALHIVSSVPGTCTYWKMASAYYTSNLQKIYKYKETSAHVFVGWF